MGKGQPVVLPSISFPTKTKATDFFRSMLNRYVDGQEVNSVDHEILYELLLRSHEANEKIGIGFKRFFRQKSPDYPTSCFHLERLDNSTTDFSYPDCISKTEPNLEQYFYRACRHSVSEILTRQKNEMFDKGNIHCSKTNEPVTKETSELRHDSPSFSQIVNDFKGKYGLTINQEMFTESTDMQYTTSSSDEILKMNFIKYHQKIATLKVFKKYNR